MLSAMDRMRENRGVRAVLAAVLAFALMVPSALLTAPRAALAAPAVTVNVTVDGLADGTIPALTGGTDFTVDEAVNADPVQYEDADGNTPLADLVEEKAKQGLEIKWTDAATGAAFDWAKSAVSKTTTVKGTWTAKTVEVYVVPDDGKTAEKTYEVTWGKSFAACNAVPATPSKDGWNFVGWYTPDGKQFDWSEALTESTSVRAKYQVADTKVVPTFDPAADIPQEVSGSCWIGDTWSVHPAHFAVTSFTGYLEGASMEGICLDRSAAQPTNTWADYTATLDHIDTEAGLVYYNLVIVPPDVTNGVDRNAYGLIGYQRVTGQLTISKSFGGYLEINKSSANADITDGNSCYSLEGAVYGVYDGNGDLRATLTTDKNGYAKSGLIPAGSYSVREISNPQGYALDETPQSVAIAGGQTTTLGVTDRPQNDPVGILIGKYDGEKTYNGDTGNLPIGSATLAGAQFSVEYYDGYYSTTAEAEASGEPTRSWVLQTDEYGYCRLTDECKVSGDELYYNTNGQVTLPLGTVVIKEVKAPLGYNLPAPFGLEQSWVRAITADGPAEDVWTYNSPEVAEPVFRGDVTFQKADEDQNPMAYVPFKITASTGESHVVVTDENGYASTKASWNKHTFNTNGNDWLANGKDALGSAVSAIASLFGSTDQGDPTFGVWFGQYEQDGKTLYTEPDDERGALPYDTYTLEELPCAANAGHTLVTKTFKVYRDSTFNADVNVDLGTITDWNVTISTEATDKATGTHEMGVDTAAAVVDKVHYKGVRTGDEYRMVATLMDKETGKAVTDENGDAVTASLDFTAGDPEGDVYLELPVPLAQLETGHDVVVFEELYHSSDYSSVLAEHKDITDQGQTVKVSSPTLGTTAVDAADGDKNIVRDTEASIVDTVEYENVVKGKDYTVTGKIMDKATGKALTDAEGNEITASASFTAKDTYGSVDVTFTFDAATLDEGTELVVFEKLFREGNEIAKHEEIDDEGQTVKIGVPEIGTTAADGLDGDKQVIADHKATVVDTVDYKNVAVGKEYTVTGTLHDKETGKALTDAEGNEITASATFTPKDTEGTVEVTFEFDAALLSGHDIVAFETLYRDGVEIAVHANIEDEAQTVEVVPPAIHTTATDAADGDKHVSGDTGSVVNDEVAYENLVPGDEYTLVGILMDKSTGLPLATGEGAAKATESADALKTLAAQLAEASGLAAEKITTTFYQTADGLWAEVTDEMELTANEDGTYTLVIHTEEGVAELELAADEVKTETTEAVAQLPATFDEEKVKEIMAGSADLVACLSTDTVTFTPEKTSSTQTVELAFDGLNCTATDTVAFEVLLKDNGTVSEVVAVHADIDDEGQTVEIGKPEIGTELTDSTDGDHYFLPSTTTTLVDTVSYTDLIPGKTYEMSGKLVNKETGETIVAGDKEVTAKATFVPNEASGTVEIEFTFDSTALEDGFATVAFEECTKDGIVVATHADINDEGQTATIGVPPDGTAYDKTGVQIAIAIACAALLAAGGGFAGYRAWRMRREED